MLLLPPPLQNFRTQIPVSLKVFDFKTTYILIPIMKNIYLLFIAILSFSSLSAQLNVEYKSHVEYNEALNDIWGYTAPDDREYALVGLQQGVSIIDVTDTENPVIKGYAAGPSSTWRDIKTWGEYAYVTNETGAGLLVIDLSNLPNELTIDDYFYWEPEIPSLNGTLSAAHNIFIDEFGFAILAGTNLNGGGLIFIDVTDPGNPQYAGAGAATYSHDVFARDNKAYSSEIYGGNFAIYDISDKSNVSLIATQNTAANFTHNTWINDAGTVLFTTDEKSNAPIGAYDISDPGDIKELDQFRPLITLNEGVIPHNVHVWNDWLIVSYYTDGVIIVDGSRPDNLIEVGNFDTYIPTSTGFNGAWGAYPFFPSETILVSDRGNGCYILEPTYVRACWLEGKVTDAGTGASIDGVKIDIDSPQLNSGETDFLGNYATGQAVSGTFDVTFNHPLYQSLTTEAVLENGVVTVLDVQLTMLASQEVSGSVVNEADGTPIPFAPIYMLSDQLEYETTADANGNFSVQSVIENDYTIFAGEWGFINNSIDATISGGPANLTIELAKGYADDFIVDLGWTVDNTAVTGAWERAEPFGTSYNGNSANPELDIEGDVGNKCYVTGNAGTSSFDDDVDNGYTILTSPVMDLTNYNVPIVKYSTWFFNDGGNVDPNDTLVVSVNNGITEVVLETISESNGAWNDAVEYSLSDFIDITNSMTVSFYTSDQVGNNDGHIVESAIDGFSVFDDSPTALSAVFDENIIFDAFPNPFQNSFSINYQLDDFDGDAVLKIYNVIGQQVKMIEIENKSGSLEINNLQNKGIYFLQIELDGRVSKSLKIIKH
jgi:choice-of-anchor B domain-containing protein